MQSDSKRTTLEFVDLEDYQDRFVKEILSLKLFGAPYFETDMITVSIGEATTQFKVELYRDLNCIAGMDAREELQEILLKELQEAASEA